MRKAIFNTTDEDYAHLNGTKVDIIVNAGDWYHVLFPDGSTIAAGCVEIELLPEEPRMSNQDIIDVIGDLLSRVYEPYSGDPSYEDEVESNERAIERAELAQAELARRGE